MGGLKRYLGCSGSACDGSWTNRRDFSCLGLSSCFLRCHVSMCALFCLCASVIYLHLTCGGPAYITCAVPPNMVSRACQCVSLCAVYQGVVMWVLRSQGDEARGAQVPVGGGMGNLHGLLLAQRGPATLNPVATGPAPANFSSSLCFYLQDVGRHPGLSEFAQSPQSDVTSSPTFQSWSTDPLLSPPPSFLLSPLGQESPREG